ncbi:MAG: efflux transporter outer membrane subunit [Syntrophaceae bacterium]
MVENTMDKPSNRTSIPRGWLRGLLGLMLVGLPLAGCAVGPDFRKPDAPAVKTYTTTALPVETATSPVAGGEAQRFVMQKEITDQWWTLFQSRALDDLISQAFAQNPSLAAAQASLKQAEENRRAAFGTLLPAVDASAAASRQQVTGASSGQAGVKIDPFNLYNASVAVSYTLDIFGGSRRELEALQSQVDYQRFLLEGTYLSLSANIVTTVVHEAGVREQIRATREILALQQRQLDTVERQLQLGAVSLADVLAQRSQLAQTQAVLPPLEKDLTQTRHQLAILTGRLPSEANLPEFDLASLSLPGELPVSLPSDLVRQRPDIRAAEALLHAASAQVGVATANLYPRITLSAAYGSEANKTGDLFSGPAALWSLGGQLLQPVFHGGSLKAQRRAAIAAYDQAGAQYRATVLQAFGNVADTLRALEADAQALAAQALSADAAGQSLAMSDKQFQDGAVSYLTLLNAQRQYQETRISLAQAQAQRYADTAALFQALGGGWWNRENEADHNANHAKEYVP